MVFYSIQSRSISLTVARSSASPSSEWTVSLNFRTIRSAEIPSIIRRLSWGAINWNQKVKLSRRPRTRWGDRRWWWWSSDHYFPLTLFLFDLLSDAPIELKLIFNDRYHYLPSKCSNYITHSDFAPSESNHNTPSIMTRFTPLSWFASVLLSSAWLSCSSLLESSINRQ